MTIKKRKSIPLSLTLGKVESESRLSVLFLGKEQLESSSQIQITESEIESMLSLRKVQTWNESFLSDRHLGKSEMPPRLRVHGVAMGGYRCILFFKEAPSRMKVQNFKMVRFDPNLSSGEASVNPIWNGW